MTSTTDQLDPSAGFYLKGAEVDDNTFVAAVRFRQLRAITTDPMTLQAAGSSRRDDDPELEAQRAVHDLVQRAVTGNKKTNVGRYADYIADMMLGKPGVLPPIHLWTDSTLETFDTGRGTFVLVPLGDNLLAIDGETQLTAHWRIAKSATGTYDPDVKKKHPDLPLSVVIHHGVDTKTARQYFHDLNILAVKPNVGIGLAMDTTDPVMSVLEDIEAAVPELTGKVDRQARQLPKRSEKIVTLSALRQMVINIAHGMPGIQYGARPAPVTEEQLESLRRLAPLLVGDFFGEFADQIADRENSLAGAAPVLAAVGAMASDLLEASYEEQVTGVRAIIRNLHDVDFSRDATWQGIAGDFTSRGVFSVKGTKEVSYAVYNALVDDRNPSFYKVRHRAVVETAAEPVVAPNHPNASETGQPVTTQPVGEQLAATSGRPEQHGAGGEGAGRYDPFGNLGGDR